jgi:hypothetical protein
LQNDYISGKALWSMDFVSLIKRTHCKERYVIKSNCLSGQSASAAMSRSLAGTEQYMILFGACVKSGALFVLETLGRQKVGCMCNPNARLFDCFVLIWVSSARFFSL